MHTVSSAASRAGSADRVSGSVRHCEGCQGSHIRINLVRLDATRCKHDMGQVLSQHLLDLCGA